MKHRISLLFAFLILCGEIFSQVSLRIYNYRPTGKEYGFVFKPTYSADLGFTFPLDEDNWVRFSASVTFLRMKTRMDTFPTYATVSGNGSGPSVLPGDQVFQKYNIIKAFAGIDAAIINHEKIKFYIGTDIIIGGTAVEYTYKVDGLVDEGYSGGGILAGIRGRLGCDFVLNEDWVIFATTNRSYFIITEPGARGSANDYGLGVRWVFIHD